MNSANILNLIVSILVMFVCDFHPQDRDKEDVLIVMNNLPFSFKSINTCNLDKKINGKRCTLKEMASRILS